MGCPFLLWGDVPDPGVEPRSPALQVDSLLTEPPGKPHMRYAFFFLGFTGGSHGKESAHSVGDPDLIPGLGRFPGEGNDDPLQYSCLKNSMDRGNWWATVHGVTQSWT